MELEKRKQLLNDILNVTGGEMAAFYEIQSRIPRLKCISWQQLQQYKQSLENKKGEGKILQFKR